MRRHRSSLSAAASPLDNDDILLEILLRLPPWPSSLPRASLVSRRWHGLVSDPKFRRRFRAHHRTPPLLGFYSGLNFVPTQDPPNRIPTVRFSLELLGDTRGGFGWYTFYVTSCRGGLVLCCDSDEFLVCDPMSGDHLRVPLSVEHRQGVLYTAALVPLAADGTGGNRPPFRIVALFSDRTRGIRAFASVYSSDTGLWETSADVHPAGPDSLKDPAVSRDSIPVGNSLYWKLDRPAILEFDLDRQSLSLIELPPDANIGGSYLCQIMPAGGGQLGVAVIARKKSNIQFWERKADCGRPARWELRRIVRSVSFLLVGCLPQTLVGFADENKVIFVLTDGGVFMVHLDTMQSRKVLEEWELSYIIPYSSF